MKANRLFLLLALTLLVTPGCEIIGNIFQAGLVVGIIGVVIVLAIVFWVFGKMRGR